MDRRKDWRRFEFQRRKFKELMLYFSQRGLDDGLVIGSTKLNKLLFFADFRAFSEIGQPITGARYQKLEWGPAARELLPIRDELLKDGEAELRSEGKADVLVP